jgi:hypothetical protein
MVIVLKRKKSMQPHEKQVNVDYRKKHVFFLFYNIKNINLIFSRNRDSTKHGSI